MSVAAILITLWLSGFITGLASGAIIYRKRTQELRIDFHESKSRNGLEDVVIESLVQARRRGRVLDGKRP